MVNGTETNLPGTVPGQNLFGTATYSRKFLNVGFFNQISEMKKTSQLENELEIMVYKFKGSKKKV